MAINPKKSACMRFGPKYRNVCANVMVSTCRSVINWMTSCRYLGVYLESSIKFKCSCQDRDGVRIFKILFTFIYITNHNENRITTKSISNSNCLIRPLPLTATTRLPASTVSQPAVTPTTCHVTCRPPYMARKRSTVTKYGVQSSRRSIT